MNLQFRLFKKINKFDFSTFKVVKPPSTPPSLSHLPLISIFLFLFWEKNISLIKILSISIVGIIQLTDK